LINFSIIFKYYQKWEIKDRREFIIYYFFQQPQQEQHCLPISAVLRCLSNPAYSFSQSLQANLPPNEFIIFCLFYAFLVLSSKFMVSGTKEAGC